MVRELLLSARTNGKTIFLSSHLLSEVELVCDRVAVLHRGKLVRLGRTADLLQSSEAHRDHRSWNCCHRFRRQLRSERNREVLGPGGRFSVLALERVFGALAERSSA